MFTAALRLLYERAYCIRPNPCGKASYKGYLFYFCWMNITIYRSLCFRYLQLILLPCECISLPYSHLMSTLLLIALRLKS